MSATHKSLQLSGKRQVFVNHFLGSGSFNAAKAARLAGYSITGARQQGFRLLADPAIRAAIEAELKLQGISKVEVLLRLGRHARGSYDDFLNFDVPGSPRIDLDKAQELGVMDLVERFEETAYGPKISLYSSQAALFQLAKIYQLGPSDFVRPPAAPTPIRVDVEIEKRGKAIADRVLATELQPFIKALKAPATSSKDECSEDTEPE